jgi:hypothetical protein
MNFTADHIRTLASWNSNIGNDDAAKAGFAVFHKMTVEKTATDEEINATAMSMIDIIRDTGDRDEFFSTMSAWGVI